MSGQQHRRARGCGSTPFIFIVYAARRTMPNERFWRDTVVCEHWRPSGSTSAIRYSLRLSAPQGRRADGRLAGSGFVLPRWYGLSFAKTVSLSARWACKYLHRFDRIMNRAQRDHRAIGASLQLVHLSAAPQQLRQTHISGELSLWRRPSCIVRWSFRPLG